jgi:hypothetical protein
MKKAVFLIAAFAAATANARPTEMPQFAPGFAGKVSSMVRISGVRF